MRARDFPQPVGELIELQINGSIAGSTFNVYFSPSVVVIAGSKGN
jgi:hypothetical protein